MTPSLRKIALTTHTVLSVGWLGAVVAYLGLAISGLMSDEVQRVRVAYLSMELIGWYIIVPLSLLAMVTGFIQSLGTQWGVLRHYWVVVKLLLTVGATIVLLHHMQTVSRVAEMVATAAGARVDFLPLQIQLVIHAAGGLLVLLVVTTLSVYKPWGMTAYGRRKKSQGQTVPKALLPSIPDRRYMRIQSVRKPTQRWVSIVGFHAIGLLLLVVLLHVILGRVSIH